MSSNVTQDFIFGTLATDAQRLAAIQADGQGLTHHNRIMPADPGPGQPVRLTASVGAEIGAATVFARYTLDGDVPGDDSVRIPFEPGDVRWDTMVWGYRQEWHGILPAQPEGTLVRYQIGAMGSDGREIWADPDPETGVPALFAYHVDRERVPDWIRDAVIYEVFVDRFRPGDGRDWNQATTLAGVWGGTLRGVVEALPYLTSLGVTCLWLTPIFPSPSHHGYDATDYRTVEPRLGTTADLAALVEAAHVYGMRVLLDFVANHVSSEHPVFRRAVADAATPERAWFTFTDWPDKYRSFFGVETLPQLDTDHAPVRDYLIDAAEFWLNLGVDGFRLDYANGPTHGFWSQFRAETRACRRDSFTMGEIVETAELQRSYHGRLDGTLDFLLLQQMRAFFAFETITTAAFDAFLQRHLAYFPDDFVLPSFLDNHDMNRFLWVVRGDRRRLKLAALCQFSLPHPPIVYYGTEVGLSQRHDLEHPDGSRRPEESRTPMPWGADQDVDLRRFYTELIGIRRRYSGLWQGERSPLIVREDGLYVVSISGETCRAVVAMNRTEAEQRIAIPGEMALALGTEGVGWSRERRLVLPAMGGALLIDEIEPDIE